MSYFGFPRKLTEMEICMRNKTCGEGRKPNWAGEQLSYDAVPSEASAGPTESSEAGRVL